LSSLCLHFGMIICPLHDPDNEQAPTPCWRKAKRRCPLSASLSVGQPLKDGGQHRASVGHVPLCFTVLLLTLVLMLFPPRRAHVRLALTTTSTLCDALPRLRATAWHATSRIALDRRRLPVLLLLAEEMIGRMTSSTAQWPWTARYVNCPACATRNPRNSRKRNTSVKIQSIQQMEHTPTAKHSSLTRALFLSSSFQTSFYMRVRVRLSRLVAARGRGEFR
jgi:hypothetical protein